MKISRIIWLVLVLLFLGGGIWVQANLKDRHRGYRPDLTVTGNGYSQLSAGFAAFPITPEVPDRWVDSNEDARYKPGDGDTFTDGNGNKRFDPVWIAGFSNRRAANGIHDDLWARTMIIDDGTTRVALVALDVIGMMNGDVIDVRNLIPADAGITYAVIAATHNHQGPDLIGMWGKTPLKRGVDPGYMEYVKKQAALSVAAAVKNLRPVRLEIALDLTGALPLLKDTRKPEVFDPGLRMIRAVDKENGNTLGTLVSWADHPETLWSKNLMITSDFPHFLREGVEKGVFDGDSLKKEGVGGVVVYVNGALGGLMCTHPSLAVADPFSGEEFQTPSFEKAEAQGKQLALLVLNALETPSEVVDSASISLVVRSVQFPVKNRLFQLGSLLGILKRGTGGVWKMRSEVAVITAGPISMVTIPGEIYPELVNGGVEAPEGNDFGIDPVEVPAIRDMMPGKFKFVVGLANDEIGYIIPKSQWDVKAPYTYQRDKAPYGEENSLGPETAPILHTKIREMTGELTNYGKP